MTKRDPLGPTWDRSNPPLRVDECIPGYYLVRFRKGAMRVPCRIIQSAEGWQTVIDGRASKVFLRWIDLPAIDAIRLAMPTTEGEYEYWLARARFARENEPDHPAATGAAVDWTRMKP